jgi:hypothetical protein
MPTRPYSHVRRTPRPAEESVVQRRRSRFTITDFSAHDDNRKKISRTRVSYGSNSRHTPESVPGDTVTPSCYGTTTKTHGRWHGKNDESDVRRESFGGKKVPELTRRSKILEHHTPSPLSVNTKRDNLNGDVTLARTISFSNSNYL